MINKRLKMPNFPKFVEVSEIWTAGAAHRVAAGKCCAVLNYDLEWFLPTKIKGKPPIRKWTIPAFPRGAGPMWLCRHLCSTIVKV